MVANRYRKLALAPIFNANIVEYTARVLITTCYNHGLANVTNYTFNET